MWLYAKLGGIAVISLLLIFMIYKFLIEPKREMKRRLGDIRGSDTDLSSKNRVEEFIESERLYRLPIVGGYYKKQMAYVTKANVQLKPSEYLIISIVLPFLLVVIVTVLTFDMIPIALAFITGIFLPNAYINKLSDDRQRKLNNQLPSFLNILSNGLRAGLSLTQSINIAIQEVDDPINWEFNKVISDLSLGKTYEEAFEDLAKRTQNDNIRTITTAIIIQKQVGGNLSELLDITAATVREHMKLQRRVRSLTSQNKLSASLIAFLPFAIAAILFFIQPDYISVLYTDPLGQLMTAGALVMMLIGGYLLKKITTKAV